MENLADLIPKIQELVAVYGLKLIAAIAIFIIGRILARWLRGLVARMMKKADVDPMIIGFVTNLAYTGLLVFVVIAALGQLGIQTTSIIAVIGAAGLAIGLALQGSLANFAAGFLMIVFRPFKVGDFIEGAGTAGSVKDIQMFTTTLMTPDNKTIIIPNAKLSGDNIINYSSAPTRRVDLTVGVAYDADIKHVKGVLEDIVAHDPRVLKDPPHKIAVAELADNSVNFTLRMWVSSSDYWGVYFDTTEIVKLRFDEEGIGIPYPQRDVHIYDHKAA
ncbi:MAG: mechanosensitive ion channel [Gammaproteobacteria bacterium]|nr:mechanosensitive ion channel [Gammaproteobacteria bacterium]